MRRDAPPATPDDLAGIALFAALEAEERETIAPWFELQHVSPDVTLTDQGAAGYSFFVLRDGTATVSIDGSDVRTLGAGDFFGELALLDDGRRTATVTTASPARPGFWCSSGPSSGVCSRSIRRSQPGSRRSCARRLRLPSPLYALDVAVEILYCPV